ARHGDDGPAGARNPVAARHRSGETAGGAAQANTAASQVGGVVRERRRGPRRGRAGVQVVQPAGHRRSRVADADAAAQEASAGLWRLFAGSQLCQSGGVALLRRPTIPEWSFRENPAMSRYCSEARAQSALRNEWGMLVPVLL